MSAARPVITAVVALVAALAAVLFLISQGSSFDLDDYADEQDCRLPPAASGGDAAAAAAALSAEQMANARRIVAVITERLPTVQARAAAPIALMTALAESSLRNLSHGDRDSLGLFQQRAGWGSAAQRRDVRYATLAFLGGPAPPANPGLLDIPGWQHLPPWSAAQAVQRSAFPDGSNYRRWAKAATALANRLLAAGPAEPALDCTPDPAVPSPGPQAAPRLPGAVPQAVRTAIAWAMRALGTPYQWGGHCQAPQRRPANPVQQNCDCSSLLQAAYRSAGVTLPRTTYEQVKVGRKVSIGEIAPGDLVFTTGSGGTAARPGHVAMYIGGGKVIQAPRTGDVVKLTDWTAYRRGVVAVVRIVP
ncbi:C40 family peptidase [Planomonospora parontospora]|uniref:C40 family peptidase n=1 Tax=Planomonospora parontospora TaxID=58119 RepID=UPI0016710D32|nr:C40 family peptidase [Planomonospora parontospora]GGL49909.1 lipoprotein [Planomonospora parontospora subsp. antibiotica]GII19329.1 lipoprotein [Planomonospora parontospora subsp. antibiotica]